MIEFALEVAEAVSAGAPLVALESSVLAQGLPIPQNREAAGRMSAAVRAAGATPAIAAVVRGVPMLGLEGDDLERFLRRDGVKKASARDLPVVMARGEDGATTVAGTLAIASHGGLRVFATGGIGGVHHEQAYDESADLMELAITPMVVVCAGAKSILDLYATMERLESLGVPVVGYGCDELPGFLTRETGIPLTARSDSPADVATIFEHHCELGRPGALLVVQPPPAAAALDAAVVREAVDEAIRRARTEGVRGAAVTPFLLAAMERATGGRSLTANLAVLESNARLAGEIAVAMTRQAS